MNTAVKSRAKQLGESFDTAAFDFVESLSASLEEYDTLCKQFRTSSKARRQAPLPGDDELVTAGAPADVIEALDLAITKGRALVWGIDTLTTYIIARVPEMKEEDNAGVAVQSSVVDLLNDAKSKLLGGAKDASPRAVTVSKKLEYLEKRGDLEAKILPSGKDAQPSNSKSQRMALHELDALVLSDVAHAFSTMHVLGVAVVTAIVRNIDKLQEPRKARVSMIG